MATAFNEFLTEKIVPELLQELFAISSKSYLCKSSADNLISSIQELLPIIDEIKNSGAELPAFRQSQIDRFSETLRCGLELSREVLASSRWNVYRNLQLARKMERLEKQIERFVKVLMHAHLLADVHRLRFETMERFNRLESLSEQRLNSMTIGSGGWVEEEVRKRKVEAEASLGNLEGFGLDLGRKNAKRMKIEKVVGVWGIGGSEKTPLPNELCRDNKSEVTSTTEARSGCGTIKVKSMEINYRKGGHGLYEEVVSSTREVTV